MRIVIDSNAWVSAIVFDGNPRKILEQAVERGFTIVSSEEIYTEVRRILSTKFPDFVHEFEQLLAVLQPLIHPVRLGSLHINVSRDHDDNRVLETAVIGKAEYIISGDKDLLVIETYDSIMIVNPLDFLSVLS